MCTGQEPEELCWELWHGLPCRDAGRLSAGQQTRLKTAVAGASRSSPLSRKHEGPSMSRDLRLSMVTSGSLAAIPLYSLSHTDLPWLTAGDEQVWALVSSQDL